MASLKCKEILCLIYSGLLFVSGMILIALSVILTYKVLYHYNFIPSSTLGPLILLFLLGILHLFLTWLGLKGPPREHNFHIILFMLFTLILLVCEFTIGIWSMILWDEVAIESVELMTNSFEDLKKGYDKKDWSKLQNQLKCCGLHGFQDYATEYPVSCLNQELSNGTMQIVHEEGCQKPLVRYVKNILLESAVTGFLAGLYQAVGLFAFYTFFRTLRAERSERAARLSAIQRQMSQGQVQPFTSAEIPLVHGQSASRSQSAVSQSVPSSPPNA